MILRIGHRGAAGHAPENTLLSIRKAIALGVDMVELDLRGTKDGHCVLLHDGRVDRTTNGRGVVAEMALDEVRRLDAGEGELIPTLGEALEVANGRVDVILEIKSPGLAEAVATAVRQSGFTGRILYASFLHHELGSVRAAIPSANTMALLERGSPLTPASLGALNVSWVGLPFDPLIRENVESLHAVGFPVFVYTANDPADIAGVKSLGVEGIISDFPERI